MFSKFMSLAWLALGAVLVFVGFSYYHDQNYLARRQNWIDVSSPSLRMYEVPNGRAPELSMALESLFAGKMSTDKDGNRSLEGETGRVATFDNRLLVKAPELMHASIAEMVASAKLAPADAPATPKIYEAWFVRASSEGKSVLDPRLAHLQVILEEVGRDAGLGSFSQVEYMRYTADLMNHDLKINKTPVARLTLKRYQGRLMVEPEFGRASFSTTLSPAPGKIYVLGVGKFPVENCNGGNCSKGDDSLLVLFRMREDKTNL